MKKRNSIYLLAFMAVGLVSCEGINEEPDPVPGPTTSSGAYILNQGNSYNQIDGSLSVIEYDGNKSYQNVFLKANGRVLGDTPQCGVVYGSKLYIGMSQSSTIEVVNRSDYKSVAQIRLDGTVVPGTQPRSMVAYDGKVFISLYDGYVARLDTTNLTLTGSVKVGPNPEIMALHNGKLYVPNSDGMNYDWNSPENSFSNGKSYTVINPDSFEVEATKPCPLNPAEFISTANTLFLLAKGNYAYNKPDLYVPSKVYIISEDGEAKPLCDATIIGKNRCGLYIVNQPFGDSVGAPEFKRYRAETNELTEWKFDAPEYVNAVAADPVSGNVLVASYVMNGLYPSYDAPGYVNRYTREGEFIAKYNVGAGPSFILFNAD